MPHGEQVTAVSAVTRRTRGEADAHRHPEGSGEQANLIGGRLEGVEPRRDALRQTVGVKLVQREQLRALPVLQEAIRQSDAMEGNSVQAHGFQRL